MTADGLIAAMDLPASARVDRRVPKTLLVDHGAPTPADRRHVNDHVDALMWVAALKPGTIAVPVFRDDVREYLEIAVLRITLRDLDAGESAAIARLEELVHRAVPYPVILCVDHLVGRGVNISAAHVRWSQGEADKTVLDGDVISVGWDAAGDDPTDPELDALSLARQPHASMFTVYQGWIDALTSVLASRVTGAFSLAVSPELAADRIAALREWDEVDREAGRIRGAAKREKQMARQVELNMQLKAIEARRAAVRERLR